MGGRPGAGSPPARGELLAANPTETAARRPDRACVQRPSVKGTCMPRSFVPSLSAFMRPRQSSLTRLLSIRPPLPQGTLRPQTQRILRAAPTPSKSLSTRDQRRLPGLGEGGGEAGSRVRHGAMNSSGITGRACLSNAKGCPCYKSLAASLGEFHVNADKGKRGDLAQLGRRRFFRARAKPTSKPRPR